LTLFPQQNFICHYKIHNKNWWQVLW